MSNMKERASKLKEQGYSYQQIADEMGIGKTTAYNLISNSGSGISGQLSGENETLVELKATIADLRNELMQGAESAEVKELIELRKLELEHEYRMEELDNNRREGLLKAEIDALKKSTDSENRMDVSVMQEIGELSSQLANLSNNFQELQKRNTELEEELSMFQESLSKTEDELSSDFNDTLIQRLASLLRQYLDIDWDECHRKDVEKIQAEVLEIQVDYENWADEAGIDIDEDDNIEILNSFIEDIDETISNFINNEEEVSELRIHKRWKRRMEEWLESIE